MTYGLHKAIGGVEARWRDALAAVTDQDCKLPSCDEPAIGVVEGWDGLPAGPICADHGIQAPDRGYRVRYPEPDGWLDDGTAAP